MTFEEMVSCQPLKLILGSYAAPKTPEAKEQQANYLALMHRALSEWPLRVFEQVADQVIRTLARGQRPMPEDFLNARKALNDAYRSDPKAQEWKCDSCGGTGWIYTNLLSKEGDVKEHCKPCPVCRRGHPYQDAQIKRDWVELESSPFKLEPTEATVKFIKATFDNDLDYSKSPAEVLAQLTEHYRMKTLKVRNTPMGRIFGNLKPSEPVREAAASLAVGSPAQEVYEVEE